MLGCAAAGVAALALAASVPVEGRAETVTPPTLTGPIKATVPLGDASHDYPYSATVDDLTKYGYVEEEFLRRGHGESLHHTPGRDRRHRRWRPSVQDANHRPPAGIAGAFNGTAVIEWNKT